MVELTLATLLNTIATDFCELRRNDTSLLTSVLISYSNANDKYGGENVRRVINESIGIEPLAVAAVVSQCPEQL